MTDIFDINQGYEALFNNLEDLGLQLNPELKDALSQNLIINDCFYDAVANGDNEMANFWAEAALDNAGIDTECTSLIGTSLDDLENFNPAESNDIYNCEESMEHWEYQGDTSRCAQFAQMFVIEEVLGYELDPDEFCAVSVANGWFDESIGTTDEQMSKMLDYFGIENTPSYDNSIDDLLECLNNGGKAIVTVDSGEYAYDEGFFDDLFNGEVADHAIEVIGYDPETDSIIVNDSGHEGGCGAKIPCDTFIDAWEDGGNFMIEVPNVS